MTRYLGPGVMGPARLTPSALGTGGSSIRSYYNQHVADARKLSGFLSSFLNTFLVLPRLDVVFLESMFEMDMVHLFAGSSLLIRSFCSELTMSRGSDCASCLGFRQSTLSSAALRSAHLSQLYEADTYPPAIRAHTSRKGNPGDELDAGHSLQRLCSYC
jgi:hypothetical protein